jgi:arylsulfatase A-like enzyme
MLGISFPKKEIGLFWCTTTTCVIIHAFNLTGQVNTLSTLQSEDKLNISTINDGKKMNILFMMGDQHRGDRVGADGVEWLETPNLDRIAKEGVLFTNAYASVPSCLPARTSILTGMSPWQSGQLGYRPIPEYPNELPRIFTNAGYRTHAVGKNHFNPMRNTHGYQSIELEEGWYTELGSKEKCDYTLWFEENLRDEDLNASGLSYTDHRGGVAFPFEDKYHPTHWTADRAIHFLENYDGDEPWLLKVSFQRPHPPFDPPKRWLDFYAETAIPKAEVGDWAERKYGDKTGLLEEQKNPHSGNFPLEEIERARRSYYAAISFVDEQIGRVLEALEQRRELENTLIIYTSDHGDMMGDHHQWRKCRPYEGSTRIPMIMRWPEALKLEAQRGQYRNELVELRDILPTFLDASGLSELPVIDGRSMLDILRNKSWRQTLDLEHAQIYEKDNAWVALTDGKHKYIYFTLTGQQQLFDLENDPYELNDLALEEVFEANKKLIEDWRKKMIKYLEVRGEEWVKNGNLVVQEKSIYFGINHPKFLKELEK